MNNSRITIKQTLSLIIILALAITAFPAVCVPSQAATAASIKMNRKTASVYIAESIRLSVSGTKSKVKWSSSNPSVATVSGGKVTGKKPGKTQISAKVSGKTLKCSVTVKYNPAAAEKKIISSVKDLDKGILIKYTNKNKYPISITTTLRYRDAAKTAVSEASDYNYCLEAGKSTWMYFPKPVDRNYQYIKYSDYKTSISTNYSKYCGCTKDITQWCKAGDVTMEAVSYNYSGKTLSAARISYLFYDSNGRLTAYMPYFPSCLQKDGHSEDTLPYPSYISSPARVESHVDYAY